MRCISHKKKIITAETQSFLFSVCSKTIFCSCLIFLFALAPMLNGAYPKAAIPYTTEAPSRPCAFQALSPYYVQQETDSSCSLATVTMVVNALRSRITPHFTPSSQQEVLSRVHDRTWTKAVAQGGMGVSLDQCARILKKVLRVYGLHKIHVDVTHVLHLASSKGELNKALHKLASTKKLGTLLIANFDQSVLIPVGEPVGHFSPLGEYIADSKQVLVMDVDKDWTGPYWVSRAKLLKSLHTISTDNRTYRGYITITVLPATARGSGKYPLALPLSSTGLTDMCEEKGISSQR